MHRDCAALQHFRSLLVLLSILYFLFWKISYPSIVVLCPLFNKISITMRNIKLLTWCCIMLLHNITYWFYPKEQPSAIRALSEVSGKGWTQCKSIVGSFTLYVQAADSHGCFSICYVNLLFI